MTFLELEKKCKKRKLLKLLKILLFVLILSAAVSFYLFKLNKSDTQNNKNIELINKKQPVKQKETDIKQDIKTNEIKKETKTEKNSNAKLNLIIDLNITEPGKTESKMPKPKQEQAQQTSPVKVKKDNSFIMTAQTLPSFETCMALAKKYYQEGNYKEALKWAKNANTQNNKKPDSWIMSARALYKLGKKDEALKILKIYYNYHKDESVKKVMGEFNETN